MDSLEIWAKLKRAGSGRWLSLRCEGWNVRIGSAWETFGADGPFAGISWLEGPEERSTFLGTSYLNRAKRDPKLSGFLAHRGETAFVGIGAATHYERVARLVMEHSIVLSAAC